MSSVENEKAGITRRDFVKATVAGGVTGAVPGVAVGVGTGAIVAREGEAATLPGTVYPLKYETDVVVAGAGNGGLSAAVSAAQEGVKAILLEISSATGGSSAYSGGLIHVMGVRTWAEYLAWTMGSHDPDLAPLFISTFLNTYIPWLNSIGAYFQASAVRPTIGSPFGDWIMGKGEPGHQGHRMYFDSLEKAFTRFGGKPILLKTRALKLLTDEKGKLAGLRASTWSTSPTEQNQDIFDIKAKAVILATGPFTWNKEMLQKYIGPYADKAYKFASPYQRGEGLLMGQEIGAALSGSLSCALPALLAITPTKQVESDPDAFEKALAGSKPTMQNLGAAVGVGRYSPPEWAAYGVLVNLDGKRYVDENGSASFSYVRAQAVLDQRQGMAFMIGDKVIHDTVSGSKAAIDTITAAGGNVVTADTIEGLAAGLAGKFPFYAGAFLKTIKEYNAAIDGGTTAGLDIPRTPRAGTHPFYRISTPPFYAIPVTAGIFNSTGGLAFNAAAQVLDNQQKPIPGLYATPLLAGGIMTNIGYTGDIALAGTFGYIAGKSAAKYAKG